MKQNVKSGKEMLNSFFESLERITSVDKNIAQLLKKLYQDGKFTEINITSALEGIREGEEK